MSLYPTTAELLEAVPHDEKLDRIPGGFRIIEAVGIVELPAELPDDALDDVSGPGQPWMFKMGPDVAELGSKGFQH